MGYLDTNGVYIYDETDRIAPIHTLLNLGMDSVGNAIEAAKHEITDGKAFIHVVHSEAERDAYGAEMAARGKPASPQNPLYVDRVDWGILERNVGAGWYPFSAHRERYQISFPTGVVVKPRNYVSRDIRYSRPFFRTPDVQVSLHSAPGGSNTMVPRVTQSDRNGCRVLVYNVSDDRDAVWTSNPLIVGLLATE